MCEQEETQLNDCLVNALAANGSCGTAAQIRANCPGSKCTVGARTQTLRAVPLLLPLPLSSIVRFMLARLQC